MAIRKSYGCWFCTIGKIATIIVTIARTGVEIETNAETATTT